MPRQLRLLLPDTCSESWDAMSPKEGGRYCASCQKKVIDFTGVSDPDIARFFEKNKGPVCGRFLEDQLNRPIAIPRRALPWLRQVATLLFPALLVSIRSGAQVLRSKAAWVQAPKARATEAPAGTRTFRGTIQNEQGLPVPFATISSGPGGDRSADAEGRFEINAVPGQKLTVSAVGYASRSIEAGHEENLQAIVLQVAVKELDNVVVAAMGIRVRMGGIMGSVTRIRSSELTRQKAAPVLKAYPNPVVSGGTIKVESNGLPAGAYQLQLITLGGQLVHSGRAEYGGKTDAPMQLPTPGVMAGGYILRLVHELTGKAFSLQVVVVY